MADQPITHKFHPGEQLLCSTGKSYKFIIQAPGFSILIDGHSHIQSGACCPLPLLWHQKKIAELTNPPRLFMDALAPLALGDGGKIQRLSIEKIGTELVGETQRVFAPDSPLRQSKLYSSGKDLFMPAIIMTMDLDYAHITGFPPTGTMIYHEGNFEKWIVAGPNSPPVRKIADGVFFYARTDAHAPEDKGKLIDVSGERPDRAWVYQMYYRQHLATIAAVKKHPWQLIPMFHYDPRRWRHSTNGEMDNDSWYFGPWDEPFKHLTTLRNAGIYIGFKMYTALGYKPLDPRLPHLEKFYARCEAEGIPILVHCSPGGMTTHDAELYYLLDGVDISSPLDHIVSCGYDPGSPIGYFNENYVHPRAWRPVLMKYPRLKLCLAHFGGNEWENVGIESDWIEEIVNMTDPKIVQGSDTQGREIRFKNVFTDVACFNMENPDVKNGIGELLQQMKNRDSRYGHLQDKLLFGVDWYLSLITKTPKYREYVESFFTAISEVDEKQWVRSSLVNPAGFYGLENNEILSNMHSALTNACKDQSEVIKKLLENNYTKVKTIKNQISQFHKNPQKNQI